MNFTSALTSVLTVAVLLTAAAAEAQLVCDGGTERFATGIPPGWSVTTSGGEVVWGALASCGEVNATGGSGDAACVSSDRAEPGSYATELRSPLFSLGSATAPGLRFQANYQNFAAADRFEVDLSLDQGASWQHLLSWNEDHGSFRQPNGEQVEIDLSPWKGLSGLMLRWRYADPDPQAFDWYAQIDDLNVLCDRRVCNQPPLTGLVANGGFESSATWTASSTQFATPLCTPASCGIALARSGNGWAFLGGTAGRPELSAVEQQVQLPAGLATLSFYLWVPQASSNPSDRLRILLDGSEVFAVAAGDVLYRSTYRRVDVDLSHQADGGNHLLRFVASTAGTPAHSNFLLDDVALEVCTAVVANPDISLANVRLKEGNFGPRDALFTVSLSAPSQFEIRIDYATSDLTATVSNQDYVGQSGTLILPPGRRSATIAVPVKGDTVDEENESFRLTLTRTNRGVLLQPNATAVIAAGSARCRWQDAAWRGRSYRVLARLKPLQLQRHDRRPGARQHRAAGHLASGPRRWDRGSSVGGGALEHRTSGHRARGHGFAGRGARCRQRGSAWQSAFRRDRKRRAFRSRRALPASAGDAARELRRLEPGGLGSAHHRG